MPGAHLQHIFHENFRGYLHETWYLNFASPRKLPVKLNEIYFCFDLFIYYLCFSEIFACTNVAFRGTV